MTEEEAKELKDATWPAEVDGQTRPTDPITVDMPYSEELPQMFSGDFVGPDQPNTAYRQLLSNGKSLKDGTTPVAKADTLTNPRTISLTGAVTGSASFDGSGDVSIATSESPTAYNRSELWQVSSRTNLVSPAWLKVAVNGKC